MERIEKLRDRAFSDSRFSADTEFYTLFYKNYVDNSDLTEERRYAEAFYYALSRLTPAIAEGELIVGNRDIEISDEISDEWNDKYREIACLRSEKAGWGQDSHMAIDYVLLLSKGINGITERIDRYLQSCDAEKAEFYISCKKCLSAVIKHSEAYSELALELSEKCDNPLRQAELKRIAEICKAVPANPAKSFYEAVQSVHFVTHCLSFNPFRLNAQQFQLGHPDRYLLPFYLRDLQRGAVTREYAQLLLDCLGIQINMRVPHGLSSGYMVGGCDENGEIVANELTEMCMQVISDIRLVYPSVGLCFTEGMPEFYFEKACRLLLNGHSHPAIFNDDIISRGLKRYGVTEAQSHNYIHSTCVEITPVAASNVWVASPYINMPQLLLDIANREYASFDELIAEYFEVLDSRIKANFEEQCRQRIIRLENSLNPLLSCFVNDCLKRGVDIERGGAVYNWIMPSFVGMANLVDSLYAVKRLVFDEARLKLCEFKNITDKNFEGNEELRLQILNRLPKYGNDCDEVDGYFGMISEHISRECEKYAGVHSFGRLIPSAFCWVMHERFGKETSATFDGRKAGFPLGDGSGACQGRERNGPTASILSATKWDHGKFIGGVAVNLKFLKFSLGENSLNTMKSVVKTYMKRGGFEVQINVVDNEALRQARKNPENYRDLVVRIGGYSDYFVKLSPEMQEELIMRTAHSI